MNTSRLTFKSPNTANGTAGAIGMSVAIIAMYALTLMWAGCSGGKELASPAPGWTVDRPISPTQYTGIGSARKSISPTTGDEADPGAALSAAKERAIADLASEISVHVESESVLESMSDHGAITEHFQSSIRSSSEANLSGYTLIDSHDDGTTVHVYYRLSKSAHAARRAALKAAALESAATELLAGAEASNRIDVALSHYADGLRALEPFLGEVNRVQVGPIELGSKLAIDRELIRRMRSVIADLRLTSNVPAVLLNSANGFSFPLALTARLPQTASNPSGIPSGIPGGPVAPLPLRYRYHNGTYYKQATEFTDGTGTVVALISDVDGGLGARPSEPGGENISVEIDLPRLIEIAHLGPWGAVLNGLASPSLSIPLAVELPALHVQCELSALRNAFRQRLGEAGHRLTDSASEADVVIAIQVQVRAGTIARGFHTAWASGTLIARTPHDDTHPNESHILFEQRIEQTKGIHLDPAGARATALENVISTLNGTPMRDLLKSLH
jgi:hypothetical protein